MAFPVILAVVALAYAITFLGIYSRNMIKVLGGMFVLVTGIILISSGVEGLDNLITLTFGFVNVGIGGWFMIEDLFNDNFGLKGGDN